jgi:hypothetical protein
MTAVVIGMRIPPSTIPNGAMLPGHAHGERVVLAWCGHAWFDEPSILHPLDDPAGLRSSAAMRCHDSALDVDVCRENHHELLDRRLRTLPTRTRTVQNGPKDAEHADARAAEFSEFCASTHQRDLRPLLHISWRMEQFPAARRGLLRMELCPKIRPLPWAISIRSRSFSRT